MGGTQAHILSSYGSTYHTQARPDSLNTRSCPLTRDLALDFTLATTLTSQ